MMLTYDFGCSDCQHVFEIIRSIRDDTAVLCLQCGSGKTNRLFLRAPAIITRHSGRADSPLQSVPNAEKMTQAADQTVSKVMKDMGMS